MTNAKLTILQVNRILLIGVLGLIELGCGSDDKPAGGQTATGGSSSIGGSTANSLGGSAAGSTGGSTADVSSTTKTQTNLSSSTTVSVQNTAAGAGLQLVSLNLVPDTASSINYVEWFGEIKNNSSSLICFPTATFTFTSSANVVLWTGTSYADAAPYVSSSSTLTMPCLAAGETGAFWDNELPTTPMTVNGVASLTVSLTGSTYSATPFPHQMTAATVPDTIYMDGNHFGMSGSFTPQQTVYNVGISGFTKATGGLLTGRLSATNLDTVTANTAWPFTSLTSIKGPQPAKLLAYPDFILGAAPNIGSADQTSADAATSLANIQLLRKANVESRQSRAKLHQNQ